MRILMIIGGMSLALILGMYMIHKIEQSAVLKHEVQEAQEDEKIDREELEIANKPDITDAELFERMQREERKF